LVALTIGATRDAAEAARRRGLAAARLSVAKAEIGRRLGDDEFAVADVARRLGVTPRTVQLLFESEGTTFKEYLVAERLAQAHRMLSDPHSLEQTVTTIAYKVGFGNLSYFNRVFRANTVQHHPRFEPGPGENRSELVAVCGVEWRAELQRRLASRLFE
jgi:AraC-like DNA-binding protein